MRLRNKKAQNTAEYAILIALVIGAVVAMQTFAQRTLQGRIRDAAGDYMVTKTTTDLGSDKQYEPYYQCTTSHTIRDSQENTTEAGANKTTNVQTDSSVETTLAPAVTGE